MGRQAVSEGFFDPDPSAGLGDDRGHSRDFASRRAVVRELYESYGVVARMSDSVPYLLDFLSLLDEDRKSAQQDGYGFGYHGCDPEWVEALRGRRRELRERGLALASSLRP